MNKKPFLPPIVSVLLVLILKFPLAAQAPRIVSVVPNTGQPGQSLGITINGENTHFVQGFIQVSFRSGTSVTDVRVVNPTRLTALLTLSKNASPGPRTVTVTTETPSSKETARLVDGFRVTTGAPALTSVQPSNGQA